MSDSNQIYQPPRRIATSFMPGEIFDFLNGKDLTNRLMYWTDRGDPPRGNTVNCAPMDPSPGRQPDILFSHLMEGIGLALDLKGQRMFVTDLAGSVYSADLDGANVKVLLGHQGNLTGIAYAEI